MPIFLISYFANTIVISYPVISFRSSYGSWGCRSSNSCIPMGRCCLYKAGEVKSMVSSSAGPSNLSLHHSFSGLIWDDIHVNCFLELTFWLSVNVLLSTTFLSLFLCQGKMVEGIAHLERVANLKEPEEPKSKAHYYDGLVLLARSQPYQWLDWFFIPFLQQANLLSSYFLSFQCSIQWRSQGWSYQILKVSCSL